MDLKQNLLNAIAAIAQTDNELHSITEKKVNKINSFSAATNEAIQYPTIKAVKDYIGDTGGTGLATKDYVDGEISTLIGGAGEAFDTLQELAEALGEDENFSTTIMNLLDQKALKSTTISAGTGLSGGGSLASNRTLSLSQATRNDIAKGVQGHAHMSKTDNPHNVTKAQVGLGSVNNTSDANKPVSTAQGQAIGAVQNNLDAYKDVIGHSPFPNYREMYLNLIEINPGSGQTPPPVPNGPSISLSDGIIGSDGSQACGGILQNLRYYDGDEAGINIGDKVYKDSQLNEPFTGDPLWYFTDNGKTIRLNNSGEVTHINLCQDEDDTPPQVPTGKSINISTDGRTSHTTGGVAGENACILSANTQRYFDGLVDIKVGDKVYQDPFLTTPYYGGNLYRMTSQGLVVRINNSGLVTEVSNCGAEITPV